MKTLIRPAAAADAGAIAEFNSAMATETEGLDLDRDRLARGVRAVIDDASKGFYLLAEIGGRVAGQMMITFEWSDWRDGDFWWIQSVYVHPEFRSRGVFRQLYNHAAERAKADPAVCGLRLYVHAANRGAQKTYERLGMSRTSYGVYEVDFVMGR